MLIIFKMNVKIINLKSAYLSDPRNFDKYG